MNEIKVINPIEQTKAMDTLKPTYGFVSTQNVLDVFQSKGWEVTKVDVLSPRKPERAGYQRHLIRLENANFPSIPGLTTENSSKPQLCLLNSHDGTTAYRMFLGLLRIACLNGVIAGLALRDFKAVHSKNVLTRLGDGIEYLSNNMGTLFNQVQALQNIQFTQAQIQEYVKTMFDARLSSVGKVVSVNYKLPLVRYEDQATDGFTVLNRVQEVLVRGGIDYTYLRDVKDDNGNVINTQTVHSTTRRLASIQQQIKLNRIAYDKAASLGGVEFAKRDAA